jgi:hypothetical protein
METYTEINHLEVLQQIIASYKPVAQERNKEIVRAYNKIVYEIRLMVSKAISPKKRRCLELCYQTDSFEDEVVREFICMFCSVTLSIRKDRYLIEFDTDSETFDKIGGVAYNALIRVAYKHTMEENTGYSIENYLYVNQNKTSQYDYFIKRQKENDFRICLMEYEEAMNEK